MTVFDMGKSCHARIKISGRTATTRTDVGRAATASTNRDTKVNEETKADTHPAGEPEVSRVASKAANIVTASR